MLGKGRGKARRARKRKDLPRVIKAHVSKERKARGTRAKAMQRTGHDVRGGHLAVARGREPRQQLPPRRELAGWPEPIIDHSGHLPALLLQAGCEVSQGLHLIVDRRHANEPGRLIDAGGETVAVITYHRRAA